MAITFSAAELAEMRRLREGLTSGTKAQINAALQAIETWLESGFASRPATSLSAAIDTATAPFSFTAAEKRLLGKVWLWGLYQKGGF